ncbi:class I SAM-dependent methyltransferase, partial [Fangia hongkongensis]
YAPSLGYYSANKYKFAEKGDFVTAPLISPLFTYTFANVFANILKGSDLENASIIEFGAGTGQFAEDCLLMLSKLNALPKSYIIIDTSPDLVNLQKKRLKKALPEYYSSILWCHEIPNTVSNAIVFANEVLDAMPVELFKYENNEFSQQMVGYDGEEFMLIDNKVIDQRLEKALSKTGILSAKPDYYLSEVNLWIEPWLSTIKDALDKCIVFICDYGYHREMYYQLARREGTLRCYYKHHVHDNPLINVGVQDITAHVDFTAVAEAALNNGFDLEGYGQQNQFLLSAGILDCYQALLKKASGRQKNTLTEGLKKLTLGADFSEVFKVMILSLSYDGEVDLFGRADLSYLL